MKMKPEHFEKLKQRINEVLYDHPNVIHYYETGNFRNSDKVKDLQRRFCFDLLYASDLSRFVCDELYSYLNDTHIYTALKQICPKVTKRY